MLITFNNEDLSSFIKVVNANRGILPQRTNSINTIQRRNGGFYNGYRYEPKLIPVDFVIVNDDLNAVRRVLASMLDVSEPAKLMFSDEPELYYMAVPDGSIDLDEVLTVGTGTINFLCPNPYAYKVTESEFSLASDKDRFTLYNYGSAPTYPKIKINFTSECGFIGVASPKGAIQVGNPEEDDGFDVPKSESMISEDFSTTGGWAKNAVQPIHKYAIANGTSKNDKWGVLPDSFGTASGTKHYSGVSLTKGFTTDKLGLTTADNWSLWARMAITGGDTKQNTGMITVGILDEKDEFITAIQLHDGSKVRNNITASLFTQPNRAENGSERAKHKVDIGSGGMFLGSIKVVKVGIKFTMSVYNERNKKLFTKTVYDSVAGGKKAKKAFVYLGKYKDAKPFNTISVTELYVTKHHTTKYEDIPNVFRAGDELIIDNENGNVTLNDMPYYETLDIGSEFFDIGAGTTELGVVYSDWSVSKPTVTALFQERYY